MIKTSLSHPLRIDEVKVPHCSGIIGMTLCPGKKIESAISGVWQRDLDIDLKVIQEWGAQAFVNLMEDHEYNLLRVPDFEEKVKTYPMEYYHLPITDVQAPDRIFERLWKEAGPRLHNILNKGGKILIHCRGGLGRTGTVAAKLLVESGMSPEKAIKAVRIARSGTIENREQENYVLQCSPVSHRLSKDFFAGCLLGGAVGDALGAAVEFSSLHEIQSRYGKDGIKAYAPCYGRKGAITDDTQMTLFTAEGILRSYNREMQRGIPASYNNMLHRAYLRWLNTQGVQSGHEDFNISQNGWLLTIKELHQKRAPGNTCISSLKSNRMGTLGKPVNDSKGCGGVMRVAPIGLFGALNHGSASLEKRLNAVFDLGCESAAITHGHPSGYLPAGCLAAIIAAIIAGNTLETAINLTLTILEKFENHEETENAIHMAMKLSKNNTYQPEPSIIEKIGGGWVGEEALAISIYCALVSGNDIFKSICLAVNHSGDSDSTGAITGNILGAMYGQTAIPDQWLKDLELKSIIEELANDLFTLFRDNDDWSNKYPGF